MWPYQHATTFFGRWSTVPGHVITGSRQAMNSRRSASEVVRGRLCRCGSSPHSCRAARHAARAALAAAGPPRPCVASRQVSPRGSSACRRFGSAYAAGSWRPSGRRSPAPTSASSGRSRTTRSPSISGVEAASRLAEMRQSAVADVASVVAGVLHRATREPPARSQPARTARHHDNVAGPEHGRHRRRTALHAGTMWCWPICGRAAPCWARSAGGWRPICSVPQRRPPDDRSPRRQPPPALSPATVLSWARGALHRFAYDARRRLLAHAGPRSRWFARRLSATTWRAARRRRGTAQAAGDAPDHVRRRTRSPSAHGVADVGDRFASHIRAEAGLGCAGAGTERSRHRRRARRLRRRSRGFCKRRRGPRRCRTISAIRCRSGARGGPALTTSRARLPSLHHSYDVNRLYAFLPAGVAHTARGLLTVSRAAGPEWHEQTRHFAEFADLARLHGTAPAADVPARRDAGPDDLRAAWASRHALWRSLGVPISTSSRLREGRRADIVVNSSGVIRASELSAHAHPYNDRTVSPASSQVAGFRFDRTPVALVDRAIRSGQARQRRRTGRHATEGGRTVRPTQFPRTRRSVAACTALLPRIGHAPPHAPRTSCCWCSRRLGLAVARPSLADSDSARLPPHRGARVRRSGLILWPRRQHPLAPRTCGRWWRDTIASCGHRRSRPRGPPVIHQTGLNRATSQLGQAVHLEVGAPHDDDGSH